MPILYRGSASTPADNGTSTGTQLTVVQVANMVVGDLCHVTVYQRGAATFSVGVSGGQTWYPELRNTTTNLAEQRFWCRFNGTWGAQPRFDNSLGVVASAIMHVFIPSDKNKYWAIDLEPDYATFTAGSTPFTKTITGVTTTRANTVTIANWGSVDGNTWGSLAGTGWTQSGMSAQYRNASGSQISAAFAYRIQTSTGATNNVSLNQATLGGDAGRSSLMVFYERDSDYLGYPTIFDASFAFTAGDTVGMNVTATSSANACIVEGYMQAASGTENVYAALYNTSGANYARIATSSVMTVGTTWTFVRFVLPASIVNGTVYNICMYTGGNVNFRYINNTLYTGRSWGFTVGSAGNAPTWPSSITIASTTIFDTIQGFNIQFTTLLGGAFSDGMTDNSTNSFGRAKMSAPSDNYNDTYSDASANTGGITPTPINANHDGYNDCFATMTGKAKYSAMSDGYNDSRSVEYGKAVYAAQSDGWNDSSSNAQGKARYFGYADNFNQASANEVAKARYAALSDGFNHASANEVGKARFAGYADNINDGFTSARGYAQYSGYADGYGDHRINSVGKTTYEAKSDGVNDGYSGARLTAYMGGISDGYNDSSSGIKGYARLSTIADDISDYYITGKGYAKYYGVADGFNDMYAALVQQSVWYGMSHNYNDSYASMYGKAKLSALSEGINDSSSGEYGKAKLSAISEGVNDAIGSAQMKIHMYGMSDGYSEANAVSRYVLRLEGRSEGYNDSSINVVGRMYMDAISDSVNEAQGSLAMKMYIGGAYSDGYNSSIANAVYGDPPVFATVIRYKIIQSGEAIRRSAIPSADAVRYTTIQSGEITRYVTIQSGDVTRNNNIQEGDVIRYEQDQ